MFKRLKLTNFRQHADREIFFENGVIVFRGLNEAGKSGAILAIAYAMFGSSALSQPLSEVVTWGAKEATLKVELDFEVNGVEYSATRSKAGAEIAFAGQLCTGQTECKRFVESLLGVSADVATKLMLANQAALRGTLEEGPTAAAALIETLADFDLIDRITQLVGEHLPSGNTAAVESQIRLLSEQVAANEPAPYDGRALEDGLDAARQAVDRNRALVKEAETELEAVREEADAARVAAVKLRGLRETVQREQGAIERDAGILNTLRPICEVTPAGIELLRNQTQLAARYATASAAGKVLAALTLPQVVWEGARASFEAELRACTSKLVQTSEARNQAYLAHQSALSRKINEKSCAFCKKDLSDVPEVARLNAELDATVTEKAAVIRGLDFKLQGLGAEEAELRELDRADRALRAVYHSVAEFVDVLDDRVPANYRWKGPDLRGAQPIGAAEQLRAAEAELARAARDAGRAETLQAAIAGAEVQITEAKLEIHKLLPLEGSGAPALYGDLKERVNQLIQARGLLDAKVTAGVLAIETALAQWRRAVEVHSGLQDQLTLAERQLQEVNLNNALVKKLRQARPKVADELWSIVLSSVSHYFSQIRGVKSAVTRADKGFQVDGRAVAGLSGSTLDALGLAIRIALTRTFLPNARFLILDEPGAACDAQRESNMLGLVASSEFDQVILVTHSDLADAFANQIVNL